jgi:5-methylcytosine-specific restriction endonuclease McrA
MSIDKNKRLDVFNKYGGRCAYCGIELDINDFQVDHKVPKRYFEISGEDGVDDIDNLMPSCSVCNHYKRSLSLENYRNEWLGKLHLRIKRIPKNPRSDKGKKYKKYMEKILERYNISEDKPFDGVFYFEKC